MSHVPRSSVRSRRNYPPVRVPARRVQGVRWSAGVNNLRELLTRQSRGRTCDEIIAALSILAGYRDNDTGRHLDRVTCFSQILAQELRKLDGGGELIDARFLRNLRRATPLHDIGKVAVPDGILLKKGPLTGAERRIMRTHAEVGAATLHSIIERSSHADCLLMAKDIAYCHHEWYDGSGYPRGLSGQEIPLSARITAVADVYDALTSRRVYKEVQSHAMASEIIRCNSGRQFDPAVIEAFMNCEQRLEQLAAELTDAGEPDLQTSCANTLQPDLVRTETRRQPNGWRSAGTITLTVYNG